MNRAANEKRDRLVRSAWFPYAGTGALNTATTAMTAQRLEKQGVGQMFRGLGIAGHPTEYYVITLLKQTTLCAVGSGCGPGGGGR